MARTNEAEALSIAREAPDSDRFDILGEMGHARCDRLFGAGEALAAGLGMMPPVAGRVVTLPVAHPRDYSHATEIAQDALGKTEIAQDALGKVEFDNLMAEGRSMTRDEAIAHALA